MENQTFCICKRRKCHAKNICSGYQRLIQAPYALESFEDNHLVFTSCRSGGTGWIEKCRREKGANARQVIRYLESLRTAGNLLEGVPLPGGGTLRLEVNCVDVKLPEGFPDHKNDNRILKVCLGLQNGKTPVILVTKDIVVRVKAQMLGIQAEDFTTEQAPVSEEQYTGRCEVFVAEKKFEDFKRSILRRRRCIRRTKPVKSFL